MLVKVLVKRNVDVGAVRKARILPCRVGGKKGMLKVNFKMVDVWVPGSSSSRTFQKPAQSLTRPARALGRRH